jgi:hypothetical protein
MNVDAAQESIARIKQNLTHSGLNESVQSIVGPRNTSADAKADGALLWIAAVQQEVAHLAAEIEALRHSVRPEG